MIFKIGMNRLLWVVTGVASLVASIMGVHDPAMYEGLVDAAILPGVFTQDIVVIVGAALLIVLSVVMKDTSYRLQVVNLGILGFLFYAYGIYAMEQVYTMLYPLYLAIFALSFYTLIYGFASISGATVAELELPPAVRFVSGGYGIFTAVMFTIIWMLQLIPLLRTGNRIENTFSIFIIDLCFIMPAFVMTAVMAFRKYALGIVGLPALFIVGVGILSPLALAEQLKPVLYDTPMNTGDFWMWAILSVVFLVFAVVYLVTLRPIVRRAL